MILQRLATAIRRQDWFQVAIEVLIVVIGIFLGLQVSEWNENREAGLEERDYLEGLALELEEKIIFNENINEELTANITRMALALDLVQSGNLNADNKGQFQENFFASTYFPHPIVQSSVISIMMASDKISLIQSSDLKDAIVGYSNEISREQINLDGQFAEFLTVRNSINTETSLPSDYWSSKVLLDSVEEISSNKVLIGKLSFTLEFQNKQLEQLREFQENSMFLEKLLLEHLESTQ